MVNVEKIFFQTNDAGKTVYLFIEEMNLGPYIIYQYYWRWIIDLNINTKTMKLLKENIGENVCESEEGKDFLGHRKHKP